MHAKPPVAAADAKAPLPRAVIQKERSKQFLIAFKDRDQAHLEYLFKEGFRIESVCTLWGSGSSPEYKSAEIARWAVDTVLKFNSGDYSCGNKPFDAHVLTLWHFEARNHPNLGGDWRGADAIIDAWIVARGKSPALREKAREILATVQKSQQVGRADIVNACATLHNPKFRGDPKDKDQARQLLQGLGNSVYTPEYDARRFGASIMSRQFSRQPSSGWRSEKDENASDVAVARDACESVIRKSNFGPPLSQIESALARWAN